MVKRQTDTSIENKEGQVVARLMGRDPRETGTDAEEALARRVKKGQGPKSVSRAAAVVDQLWMCKAKGVFGLAVWRQQGSGALRSKPFTALIVQCCVCMYVYVVDAREDVILIKMIQNDSLSEVTSQSNFKVRSFPDC